VETVGLTPWLLASSKAFEVHGNRFDVLSFQALPLHFPLQQGRLLERHWPVNT